MQSSIVTTLRTLFVLLLLFVLPLLAMPQVLRRIDAFLEPDYLTDEIDPAVKMASHSSAPVVAPVKHLPHVEKITNMVGSTGDAITIIPADQFEEIVTSKRPVEPQQPWQKGVDSENFRAVQNRLRQLGANYMALESTGDNQQPYRFYCAMGIAGNSVYSRSFEAYGADPMQTMHQVLRDVEVWKAVSTAKQQSPQGGLEVLR